MVKIISLDKFDLEEIMQVERKAFIPSIRTTKENIKKRLKKGHIYLGAIIAGELVGTLALRFANFVPDFSDFVKKCLTFQDYAEQENEQDANAAFVYSLGVLPEYRSFVNARKLILGAFNITKSRGMEFLVGDARIPSHNGSNNLPYEQFKRNQELHKAIDNYFKTGVLPSRLLIEQDPVAGFYLKIFPEGKILGVTDETFWKGDKPCGGHMLIEYLRLK